MTNYNDGAWHSWAGGARPVHCESIIEAVYVTERGQKLDFRSPAGDKMWDRPFLFRVVEEYKEAREFWIGTENGYQTIQRYEPHKPHNFIHVREVLE